MADQENLNSSDQKAPIRTSWLQSKKRLVIVGALLLIVVIGIAGLYLPRYINKKLKTSQKDKEPVPVLSPAKRERNPTTDFDKAILAADKFITAKDYDGAIKSLEPFVPNAAGASQQYAVMSRLGIAYSYKNDPQTAIMWYERAQQTGQAGSDSLALKIALEAEKAGDKPKAIAAYQKVIELLHAYPNPTSDTNIQQYQAKIKALGG